MKTIHLVTADPQRTPTLTLFAHHDYFLFTGSANCATPCISVPTTPPSNTFAWNHAGIQPEIATIWLGLVGPGIGENGQDDQTWSDHTDVRPTMLALTGLRDSYVHDGRVLTEAIDENAQPVRLRGHTHTFGELVRLYKQINAPFGQLGMDAVAISTFAIGSGDASNDSVYTSLTEKLAVWTAERDMIAGQIKVMLDEATFEGAVFDEVRGKGLVGQAKALLDNVHVCASAPGACAE